MIGTKRIYLPEEDEDEYDTYNEEKLQHYNSARKISSKTTLSLVGTLIVVCLVTLSVMRIPLGLVVNFGEQERSDAHQTFEIQLPILYEDLVYQQTLLTHSFGDSWGKPAKVVFKNPVEKTYNRIVLTLNTTVDGVQYDRLAHVFVNDIPVWRTSTAEPGNDTVFTTSSKDVSKYLPLFQNLESQLTFQLDNLITRKLTGVFNTTLSVGYYYIDQDDDDKNAEDLFKITNKPATKVSKLIDAKPNRTPLLYYPSDQLSFVLPQIHKNTTSLSLALYVSGNAAEEFWYSNILEENKKRFDDYGHSFLGHGPVRVINVYIDGIRVFTNAPEPVIFSGGISPALWRPIIGVNSFDLKSLDIDLTAVLPLLWNSDSQIEVEITNGQDKITASNWIVSASLLHWESPLIADASGAVQTFDNSSHYGAFGISTSPENYYQNVISNHSTSFTSLLDFTLNNGTVLPFELSISSKANFVNFQKYADYADYQFLATVISSSREVEINLHNRHISTLKSSHVYPLVITISSEPIVSYDVSYTANVTNLYSAQIKIDGKKVLKISSLQNGTSFYTLSPAGNHGYGSTDQRYKAYLRAPFPKFVFKAQASAVNGTLTKAPSTEIQTFSIYENLDIFSDSEFQNIAIELDELLSQDQVTLEFVSLFANELSRLNAAFETRKAHSLREYPQSSAPRANIYSKHLAE